MKNRILLALGIFAVLVALIELGPRHAKRLPNAPQKPTPVVRGHDPPAIQKMNMVAPYRNSVPVVSATMHLIMGDPSHYALRTEKTPVLLVPMPAPPAPRYVTVPWFSDLGFGPRTRFTEVLRI